MARLVRASPSASAVRADSCSVAQLSSVLFLVVTLRSFLSVYASRRCDPRQEGPDKTRRGPLRARCIRQQSSTTMRKEQDTVSVGEGAHGRDELATSLRREAVARLAVTRLGKGRDVRAATCARRGKRSASQLQTMLGEMETDLVYMSMWSSMYLAVAAGSTGVRRTR